METVSILFKTRPVQFIVATVIIIVSLALSAKAWHNLSNIARPITVKAELTPYLSSSAKVYPLSGNTGIIKNLPITIPLTVKNQLENILVSIDYPLKSPTQKSANYRDKSLIINGSSMNFIIDTIDTKHSYRATVNLMYYSAGLECATQKEQLETGWSCSALQLRGV